MSSQGRLGVDPAHPNRQAQWDANLEEQIGIVTHDSTILRADAEIRVRTRSFWARSTLALTRGQPTELEAREGGRRVARHVRE